ncbi:hypothetical protein B0H14DRAFT_2699866 [Mycena olivaceomarginata]|nr:hypothetical protein B0H14DRAFT_2699866 [Mycena olivaceomarginata]
MSTQFYRINVTSPLVQYFNGAWNVPPQPDQALSASCHGGDPPNHPKCSASLQFIGKNITLSLVDIHCDGDDNNCFTIFNGGSQQTFKLDDNNELTFLIPATGSEELHNFNLTASNINLGCFNLSSTVGSTNDLRVQNDAPVFAYNPPDAWRTNMISLPGIDGGNVSTTNQTNTSVTFSFKGDRVALYGSVGAQVGYTAQLDNRLALTIAPSLLKLSESSFPELIFFAAGLNSTGNHSVTLISTSDEMFTVDSAVVDGDVNTSLSAASSSSTMSPDTSNTVLPNTTILDIPSESIGLSGARLIGLIAGIAVLVALLLIALGYIVCLRRRRNRREEETPRSFDDFPPPHSTGATPAPTEYTQTSQQPLFLVPQPQPQRTSWDARSFDSRSSATLDESSEGYQDEVYAKRKFDSYARGSLPVGFGKNRSSNVGLDTSQETGLVYAA